MKLSISSRLTGVKHRLAGFSLRTARQDLLKLERLLHQTSREIKSIELSHHKLSSSPRLVEKLGACHVMNLKHMESLKRDFGVKQNELQKKVHLEERWGLFHAETREHEIAMRDASQSEDLLESHTARAAAGLDSGAKGIQSPVVSDVEPAGIDAEARPKGYTPEEEKSPVNTELVEGRVLARLERDENGLQITLITHSAKDQQLLNRFRRKYARIAEDRGSRCASIRVERRK